MSAVAPPDVAPEPIGSIARQKRAAADRVVDEVRSGMVVGLGAGSTGLFLGLATELFVGTSDGVRRLSRHDRPVQR